MTPNSIPDVVRVLLVDDDEEDYLIIKHLFASMKSITSQLEWVASSDEALVRIAANEHDAYLIDYRIDGRTGLDVLNESNAFERPEPFILLTGVGDESVERESLQLAASDYLIKKNLTSDSLARTLYYALGRKEQEKLKIEQLLEINRTKDEFISIASHQLRTPATTVKQYVAMVLDGLGGEISEKQRMLLTRAYESNERQLSTINNLLKVAQLDSNTFQLSLKEVDVSQLVRDAVEDVRPWFHDNGQILEVQTTEDARAAVDENAFRMIIDNLLENACKYSEPTSITKVSVSKQGERVIVRVSDQGVGVGQPEQLFKKFSRVKNKLSEHVNGTGIGLYWAQSIARLHGGDLSYIPGETEGSIFEIHVPMVK